MPNRAGVFQRCSEIVQVNFRGVIRGKVVTYVANQPCLPISLEKYAVQVFSPGEVGRESNTEVFLVVSH